MDVYPSQNETSRVSQTAFGALKSVCVATPMCLANFGFATMRRDPRLPVKRDSWRGPQNHHSIPPST